MGVEKQTSGGKDGMRAGRRHEDGVGVRCRLCDHVGADCTGTAPRGFPRRSAGLFRQMSLFDDAGLMDLMLCTVGRSYG